MQYKWRESIHGEEVTSGRVFFLYVVLVAIMSSLAGRDSAVVIATRYGLESPKIEFRWEATFSAPAQTGPGAQPVSYTMGTGSFPGVKQPERGVDHPPHLAPRLEKE
jgi:hypothetical protein